MIPASIEAEGPTARRPLLSLVLLALAHAGCGGGAAGSAPSGTHSSRPEVGAIELLLPSGAERVIVARPAELMAWQSLAEVLRPLVAGSRADRLARENGLDLSTLEAVAWADYGGAELMVARVDSGARERVERVGEQLMAGQLSSSDALVVRSGLWGDEHRIVAAPDDRVLLLGVGDVGAEMTAVLAYLRSGRWPAGTGALFESDVEPLHVSLGDSPLAVYMPRPLDLPLDRGFGRLMAGETALGVSIAPAGSPDGEEIALEAAFLGVFPEEADENFRTWIDDLAASDMGHILGIAGARSTFAFRAASGKVELALILDTAIFSRGLRDLFLVEISELSAEEGEGPE